MRRLVLAAVLLVAVVVAAGCTVPPPPGAAPLRYRDAVFSGFDVTRGLQYGSAPDLSGNPVSLTLNMYQPTGDTQTKRPAIVLVHGGGFVSGTAANGAMVLFAQAFAQRGYVAVSINYRLLGNGNCAKETTPSEACINAAFAAQHDAQAAVRWLRANAAQYRVDPTRIMIGGGSAGAVTALAVAVHSDDPGTSGNPGYSSKVGGAISISGHLPSSIARPLYDPADSPIIMFQGTADTVNPVADALATVGDLWNAHVGIVYEPLEGGGHVPMAQFGDLMIEQSLNFSYAVLDLAHAQGQPAAAAKAYDAKVATLRKRNPRLRKHYPTLVPRRVRH